jgi:hypothetical protein
MNTAAAAVALTLSASKRRHAAPAAKQAGVEGHSGLGTILACYVVVMGLLFVLQPDVSLADPSVAQVVVQHHQQVTGRTTPALDPTNGGVGQSARELAQRYQSALPATTRQRLSDQARQEQRESLLPAGQAAFVQRRLALYEAELQRGATALSGPQRL